MQLVRATLSPSIFSPLPAYRHPTAAAPIPRPTSLPSYRRPRSPDFRDGKSLKNFFYYAGT